MLEFGKGIRGLALALTLTAGVPTIGMAQLVGPTAIGIGGGGSGSGGGGGGGVLGGNNSCVAVCSTNSSSSSSSSTTTTTTSNTVANSGTLNSNNGNVNNGNINSNVNSGNVDGTHTVVVGTRVFAVPGSTLVTAAVPVTVAANTGGAAFGS